MSETGEKREESPQLSFSLAQRIPPPPVPTHCVPSCFRTARPGIAHGNPVSQQSSTRKRQAGQQFQVFSV